jgi:hypothetical protein
MLSILNELELSKDSVILNAAGFSMEMQMQDNDRMNVVYNYVKIIFKKTLALKKFRLFHDCSSFLQVLKKITNKTFY